MHPTKVSYTTTDKDGVERRMTKEENKKKKAQLMKERLSMMKQIKKQQRQEKEELSGTNTDLQAKIDELTAALEKCKKD